MATTLNNVDEDLLFYEELKHYVYGKRLTDKIDNHNRWEIKKGIKQIETMFEYAIAKTAGIKHTPIVGMDFADGSDAKKVTSSFRNNNIKKGSWKNTYTIHGIRNKKGILRVMGYNRVLASFDYFAIPYDAYSHLKGESLEIMMDSFSGHFDRDTPPVPRGIVKGKFLEFKVDSFEEMAKAKFN